MKTKFCVKKKTQNEFWDMKITGHSGVSLI